MSADDDAELDDDDAIDDGADVDVVPRAGADSADEVAKFVPKDLLDLYEVYSYRHGALILTHGHAAEFEELRKALLTFNITTAEIIKGGGNNSDINKKMQTLLYPNGWHETRIAADLKVTKYIVEKKQKQKKGKPTWEGTKSEDTVDIPNFVDGHKVDYVKNRVAFDMEWNSKDQTFDRDLYALRAFYECSLISAGVIVTRSEALNPVFESLPDYADGKRVKDKYGASTTWMGKLIYRLNANRNGGCPVLVFCITPKLVTDWKPK